MRIFTAPLNSEVEVARNVHDLVRVLGPGKGKDVKVRVLGASRPRQLADQYQTFGCFGQVLKLAI